ncbi:MAG TPA: hypothetical protein VH637_09065 [Streptosporangiaceae bacterium]|jgi:hypothetical protein
MPVRWRAALALAAVALTAGCGPKQSSSAGISCGTAKTAANVPVKILLKGSGQCQVALSVERDYAKAILAGSAPGNGGGGPVKIDGWTCQGFTTPVVLRTGQASKCTKAGAEILAILPSPA